MPAGQARGERGAGTQPPPSYFFGVDSGAGGNYVRLAPVGETSGQGRAFYAVVPHRLSTPTPEIKLGRRGKKAEGMVPHGPEPSAVSLSEEPPGRRPSPSESAIMCRGFSTIIATR